MKTKWGWFDLINFGWIPVITYGFLQPWSPYGTNIYVTVGFIWAFIMFFLNVVYGK